MPIYSAFRVEYKGIATQLRLPVHVFPAFDLTAQTPPPLDEAHEFLALWDTGATRSGISSSLAVKLGLQPISFAEVHTAGGTTTKPVYAIGIFFPHQKGVANLPVNEVNLHGGIDVLLGMDVMCGGDFAVSNFGGKTVFSFRAPSVGTIDLSSDGGRTSGTPMPERASQPGRNDPCPCGSGKKFKKCCGK